MIFRDVTVMPYFKSGDDMANHLENAGDNPVQALRNWADHMEGASKQIRELASQLEGMDFTIDAMTHHVGFHGLSDETIDKLAKLNLVYVYEEEIEDFDEDEEI